MRAATRPVSGRLPGEIREAIESFIRACREPALFEPGDPPLRISADNLSLEPRGAGLVLEAWDDRRNLARRILDVTARRPGRLELSIERFGQRTGTLVLADLARPGSNLGLRAARLSFAQQFRRCLSRRFPGWKLAELSTEPDLEHTLSPAFPRAFLTRGGTGWAAIALPPGGDASAVLPMGLIWLDYLRSREHRTLVEGLALFLPEDRRRPTSLRLPHLNPGAAQFALYLYTPDGIEELLDPHDYGNLDTRLEPCSAGAPDDRFSRLAGVERAPLHNGWTSFRVHGLEFARAGDGELWFGIDRRRKGSAADFDEIERLARELARLRSGDAPDRSNPLYLRSPELWLESQVRANLSEIDASLIGSPVYGQVPAMAGGERGVIDLLACEHGGRLAVIELKASEDPALPLQALDYWMRVKWHLDRGEFAGRGYFRGIDLAPDPPRLLLVAPAFAFHPSTETLLRYLSPVVEVERIGLGLEWRKAVKTVFRFRGARRPL